MEICLGDNGGDLVAFQFQLRKSKDESNSISPVGELFSASNNHLKGRLGLSIIHQDY